MPNKFSVQRIDKPRLFYLLIGVCTSIIVLPNIAAAANNPGNNVPSGITISPITQELSLPHTQPQIGTDILVTDNTPVPATLTLRVVDFNSLDETGGILFAGSKESTLTAKFGLAKWAILSDPTLSLEAGQTRTVHLLVQNSTSLSPGGHYGAVLFQLSGVSQKENGSSVSLNQVLSSLVFVSKLGGEKYDLSLQRPSGGLYWATLPSRVTLRFFAGGNEYLIPRGTLTVFDPFGKVAAHGVINESSNIVLPQTHRRYPVTLSRSISSLLPGRYNVKVLYRYDGEEGFTELNYGFWVVNVEGIAILLGLLALFALAYYKRRALGRITGMAASAAVKFISRAG